MADSFSMKKEDRDKLVEAGRLYDRLLGSGGSSVERLAASVPLADPDADAKRKAEEDKQHLERQAKLTREAEDARQREQRAKLDAARGAGAVQAENPGPGQPAMATDKAKAQGADRKGEEPASAAPANS